VGEYLENVACNGNHHDNRDGLAVDVTAEMVDSRDQLPQGDVGKQFTTEESIY